MFKNRIASYIMYNMYIIHFREIDIHLNGSKNYNVQCTYYLHIVTVHSNRMNVYINIFS